MHLVALHNTIFGCDLNFTLGEYDILGLSATPNPLLAFLMEHLDDDDLIDLIPQKL